MIPPIDIRPSKRFVPDDGPLSAEIAIIGEAPGREEHVWQVPFIGASGDELKRWWKTVGLKRADIYVTNLYPYWPGTANAAIGKIPRHTLERHAVLLRERLGRLPRLKIVVPLGNYALWALRGHQDISKWRGSILPFKIASREIKCIPSLHPAATFRRRQTAELCISDWHKIADELRSDRPIPSPSNRSHVISPTLSQLVDFAKRAERAPFLTIDIETPRGMENPTARRVLCIGFCIDPGESLVVPIRRGYWRSRYPNAMAIVRQLIESKTPKSMQFGFFDSFCLSKILHIDTQNWVYDTLALHHAISPIGEHSLAALASVDSREPYWKGEGKRPARGGFLPWEQLYRYNGKDACVQTELTLRYAAELRQSKRWAFYLRHYKRLFTPIRRIMAHGVAFDQSMVKSERGRLLAEAAGHITKLNWTAGSPLTGKKGGLSNKKLHEFFFEVLEVKPKINRKTGGSTLDEVAVKRIAQEATAEDDTTTVAACGQLLAFRKAEKTAQFLSPGRFDADGRLRSSYAPFAESGRMRSSENPFGTGSNGQNISEKVRHLVIPDEGCLFLGVDGAQAESRVVDMLCNTKRGRKRALLPPWEGVDIHTQRASKFFNKPPAEISKRPERYAAKRTVHGWNYGEEELKVWETLIKDDILDPTTGAPYTIEQIRSWLAIVESEEQDIRSWQDRNVREIIARRTMMNPFGRVIHFKWDRFDGELYRRAHAFRPQSTVADWLNLWGFEPLDRAIRHHHWPAQINLQTHDGLLVSVRPKIAWEVWSLLHKTLVRPIEYLGHKMAIPLELTLGDRWKSPHTITFKKPPSRADFRGAISSVVDKLRQSKTGNHAKIG